MLPASLKPAFQKGFASESWKSQRRFGGGTFLWPVAKSRALSDEKTACAALRAGRLYT